MKSSVFHLVASAKRYSQNNDQQNNCQDHQQTTSLVPRVFLVPTGLPQLHVGSACLIPHIFHINIDTVDHVSLFTHDRRNVAKELVELADSGLDVADLGLTFDDKGLLEIDG